MKNAILLSAGYGKRLHPLTLTTPKCLIKIGEHNLLKIWIDKLTNIGVEKKLINTHYLSSKVEKFINENYYDKNIVLYHENILLGTSKTLINNLSFFNNNDGLVLHTDNYCQSDLNNIYNAHFSRPKECLMTMFVFKTDDYANSGIIKINNKDILVEYYQKKEIRYGDLANAAIFLLSPNIFDELIENHSNSFDISNDIIPSFLNRIFVVEIKELFLDIGTLEKYNLIQNILNKD